MEDATTKLSMGVRVFVNSTTEKRLAKLRRLTARMSVSMKDATNELVICEGFCMQHYKEKDSGDGF